MSKPLFDNVGRDMKEYATGLYTTSMRGYGLTALVVGIASLALLGEMPMFGILGVIIAVAVVVVGHYKAKLSVMKLYAYGELVDRVMHIENNLYGSKSNNRKPVSPMPHNESPVKPVLVDLPITDRNPDGTWTCMFCDYKNPVDAKACKKCDAMVRFK